MEVGELDCFSSPLMGGKCPFSDESVKMAYESHQVFVSHGACS